MAVRVTRSLAAVGVVALVSLAGTGLGQQGTQPPAREPGARQPGQPGQEGGARRGDRENSTEGMMKGVRRALRQLSAQVTDPQKKDENLRLIGDMERGLVMAKNMPLPEKVVKDADEAGKAKLAAEYRKDLIAAVRLLLDAEEDVAAGKGEDAKAKLKKLEDLRDSSHEAMGLKDD